MHPANTFTIVLVLADTGQGDTDKEAKNCRWQEFNILVEVVIVM